MVPPSAAKKIEVPPVEGRRESDMAARAVRKRAGLLYRQAGNDYSKGIVLVTAAMGCALGFDTVSAWLHRLWIGRWMPLWLLPALLFGVGLLLILRGGEVYRMTGVELPRIADVACSRAAWLGELLDFLSRDLAPDGTLAVRCEMRPTDTADKCVLNVSRGGKRHLHYVDPWLDLSATLADGNGLRLRIDSRVKIKRKFRRRGSRRQARHRQRLIIDLTLATDRYRGTRPLVSLKDFLSDGLTFSDLTAADGALRAVAVSDKPDLQGRALLHALTALYGILVPLPPVQKTGQKGES